MSVNEWNETAKIVVDDCLAIQENEEVLFLVGEGIEQVEGLCDLYAAVKEELYGRGMLPTIISYRAGLGVEPPALIEQACCSADAVICIYVRGFLHSGMFPRIQQNKKPDARLLLLPNGNSHDFLNRMMPKTKEAFYEVADLTDRVGGKFMNGAHTVHITDPNGTDLTFTIGQLNGWNHTGVAKKTGGFALLPAGTLNLGVDPGSAEGTLVIDTFTATKDEPLTGEIVFEIHNGSATSVTGSSEADDFVAAADKVEGTPEEKYCVAEFGLGFVNGADYLVNLGEGEHVYGGTHIGIGSNVSFGGTTCIASWHSDSLLPNASVELDGVPIVENGEFVVL